MKLDKKRIFTLGLALIGAILLSSCSIKKNKNNDNATVNTLSIEEMQDSDGDGVPDTIEIQRGTNPFVADIPRIKVSKVEEVAMAGTFRGSEDKDGYIAKEIVLPQRFVETGDNKGADRDFLKALRKKALENQVAQIKNIQASSEDKITNEDLRTSILSNWDNDTYFKALEDILNTKNYKDSETGKVSYSFKIKLQETFGVTEVSNIKLKTFFYNFRKMEEVDIYPHFLPRDDGTKERILIYKDKEANPVTLYKIISGDLPNGKIAEAIINRNQIGLKFTDYDFVSSGIALNYSTVLQNVLDHDAKIVFSNPEKTEVFFVSPRFTLEEALAMLGKKITKDSRGGIYSIDGIETNASLPIDFDTISKKDYLAGAWSIIGDADSLSSKLTEKGLYVISYATIKDLVNANRSVQNYPESSEASTKRITLEKVTEGDELELKINSIQYKTLVEAVSSETHSKETGNCSFVPPVDPMKGPSGCKIELCTITKATPSEVDQFINIDTNFLKKNLIVENELGDVIDFSAYFAKDTIQLVFDKQLPLQRNNLTVSFKTPQSRVTARHGTLANTCESGKVNYSTINYEPAYFFTKEANIFTQTKY